MYVPRGDLFMQGDGLGASMRHRSASDELAGASRASNLGLVPAVAAGLAKGAITAVGSIFGGAKDKDPGRLQHIQGLINRAANGDRSAWDGNGNPASNRDNLLWWSTHYATSTAKSAARKAYDALAAIFADQTAAAPQGGGGVVGAITPAQAGFGAGGIALMVGLALMMSGGPKRRRR